MELEQLLEVNWMILDWDLTRLEDISLLLYVVYILLHKLQSLTRVPAPYLFSLLQPNITVHFGGQFWNETETDHLMAPVSCWNEFVGDLGIVVKVSE